MWSDWLVFCDCGFQSVCPLMKKDKGLWKLPNGRDWLRGKLDLVLLGAAMLSKSLMQFSVDGWSCVPSLLFTWGQTMVEVMKINNDNFIVQIHFLSKFCPSKDLIAICSIEPGCRQTGFGEDVSLVWRRCEWMYILASTTWTVWRELDCFERVVLYIQQCIYALLYYSLTGLQRNSEILKILPLLADFFPLKIFCPASRVMFNSLLLWWSCLSLK